MKKQSSFLPPGGEKALGFKCHIKDSSDKKHRTSTMMCAVCKNYVEHWTWDRTIHGYYPFCDNCLERQKFITLHVPYVGLPEKQKKLRQSIAAQYVAETAQKQGLSR